MAYSSERMKMLAALQKGFITWLEYCEWVWITEHRKLYK